MKKITAQHLPRMRSDGLVMEELPDELLVYDLERHKAHCLNRIAALVWRHCDGNTTAVEIASRIEHELQSPVAEDLVWLALGQLKKLHLLEERYTLPAQIAVMTRREMVRRLGIATAVAVPVVTSIIAPAPAQAATCIPSGGGCNPNIACCTTNVACAVGNCP